MFDALLFYWEVLIFLIPLLGIAAYIGYRTLRPKTTRLEAASRQYLESVARSEDPKYSFNACTAEIVRRIEDRNNGEDTTYVLIVYAKNSHGEYFVFKSDGVRSSIKHLDHGLAEVILKQKHG